jgi:hypothetical protein
MTAKKLMWLIVIGCMIFLSVIIIRSNALPQIAKFFYNTENCGDSQMKLPEALEIASYSECSEKGKTFFWGASCNSYTGTWWLSYSPNKPSNCNPRCVVKTDTKEAEVNYMCVGGINPK